VETPFQRLISFVAAILTLSFFPLSILAQTTEPAPLPAESVLENPESEPKPEPEDSDWETRAVQAINDLSSDDFLKREAATLNLWRIGEKAEPLVRKATESDRLEVRTRAQRLLALFMFGIYPDTPKDILEQINQFRHGDAKAKTTAIQYLYSLGEVASVTKLIRSVENQALRNQLVNSVVSQLQDKLSVLFDAGNFDEAESLLKLTAISDEGMRDLAAFYLYRGVVDAKIEEILNQDGAPDSIDSVGYQRLSWFYRVKGDLDNALAAAEKSKTPELVRDIKIAQGDLLTYIKACHNPNDRTIQSYGFKAAAQRLSGDDAEFEKTIEAIRVYHIENPEEEHVCLQALIINGRLTDAMAIARRDGPNHTSLLSENGFPAEALATLGIENPRGTNDKWLAGLKKEFGEAQNNREFDAALARAQGACGLLSFWGEEEAVERIFEELGEIVTKSQVEFLTSFIASASSLGLSDFAMDLGRAAIKKEIEEAEAAPELLGLKGLELEEERVRARVGQRSVSDRLIGAIFQFESSVASFWWEHLKSRYPEKDELEALDMVYTLLKPIPNDKEENPEALALIEKLLPEGDFDPADEEELPQLQSRIADLYLRNGKRDKAFELYEKGLQHERSDLLYAAMSFGNLLAEDGRWDEAATYFKIACDKAKETTTTKRANSFLVTLYAVALERAGRVEEGQAVLKDIQLRSLGKPFEHRRIASALAQMGEYGRSRASSQLTIHIASLNESTSVYGEALRLGNFLATEDPAKAAIYKERYLLEFLKSHVNSSQLSSLTGVRAAADLSKARVALKEDRADDAVKIVGALADSQRANTSVLEDLYPLLVEAGKKKEADAFYEKFNKTGTAAVELFPNSPSDLNSLAWLKARCGKDLDKALEMSLRSNKLRKGSYAYIDTLAEVYFQLGQRDKAIENSERAVKLSSGDYLLHQQLERFKYAKPLSTRLKE